ncbi:MAG: hypothetical protein ACREQQ_15035, partial [Candidatus Binatia bacterium]
TGADGREEPSLHAFHVDPALHVNPSVALGDAEVAWQQTAAQSFGATSIANGVVFLPTFYGRDLRAYDAATGNLLVSIPTMLAAGGSSAVVVGDSVYVGSGESFQPLGGGVHAFHLPPVDLPIGGL